MLNIVDVFFSDKAIFGPCMAFAHPGDHISKVLCQLYDMYSTYNLDSYIVR